MNPYELLIPQLLAGAVIVVIALRAVRRARREAEAHEQRIANRQQEHARFLAQLGAAAANPGSPASTFVAEWARPSVLRVTLGLADPNMVVDILRMTREAGELIAGLSEYETRIGGRGLLLTGMKAEPGQVILTLIPKDAAGAGSRVERVADAINAAFGTTDRSTGVSIPDLGRLPHDVAGAHAVALAA